MNNTNNKPYIKNKETGAINLNLKLERKKKGGHFEWPNILELNKLMANYSKDKVVLDIGCGTGATAYYMSKNAKQIIALEPDKKTLEWAKKNRARDNIKYLSKYTFELDNSYDSYFDLITAIDVIEHIEDYFIFIKDCLRLLKEKGTLIVTSPNRLRENPPKIQPSYKHHVQEFTPGELYFIFDMFFKNIQLYALKNPYDRKTIYPIDVNSKAHTTIIICSNLKRRLS